MADNCADFKFANKLVESKTSLDDGSHFCILENYFKSFDHTESSFISIFCVTNISIILNKS